MLSRLKITDFQGIEDLDVPLGPITVFHGESDSGKSSVVRALFALGFNSYPAGHVRRGASRSTVSVVAGTTVVQAVKGAGDNVYRVRTSSGEKLVFDRVGREVPGAVVAALGWAPVTLDDASRVIPNFHRQFDSPFLLSDSPARAAKVLGSLTNIARLFSAIRLAGSDVREAKSTADRLAEEAIGHTARADAALETLMVLEPRLDRVSAAYTEAAEGSKRLAGLVASRQAIEASAGRVRAVTAELEGIPSGTSVDMVALESKVYRLAELRGIHDQLSSVERELALADSMHRRSEEDLRSALDSSALLREELGGVCPLCGSALHDDAWEGSS